MTLSVPEYMKMLARHNVVLTITCFVLSIVGATIYAEAQELFSDHIDVVLLHQEQITIALLLMGFGAYVQAVEFIISNHQAQKGEESRFDLRCSLLGLAILVIGVLIEIVDHILHMLSENREFIIWVEYTVNYPASIFAAIFLIHFLFRFFRLGRRLS